MGNGMFFCQPSNQYPCNLFEKLPVLPAFTLQFIPSGKSKKGIQLKDSKKNTESCFQLIFALLSTGRPGQSGIETISIWAKIYHLHCSALQIVISSYVVASMFALFQLKKHAIFFKSSCVVGFLDFYVTHTTHSLTLLKQQRGEVTFEFFTFHCILPATPMTLYTCILSII